jgi:hypothetical protein
MRERFWQFERDRFHHPTVLPKWQNGKTHFFYTGTSATLAALSKRV